MGSRGEPCLVGCRMPPTAGWALDTNSKKAALASQQQNTSMHILQPCQHRLQHVCGSCHPANCPPPAFCHGSWCVERQRRLFCPSPPATYIGSRSAQHPGRAVRAWDGQDWRCGGGRVIQPPFALFSQGLCHALLHGLIAADLLQVLRQIWWQRLLGHPAKGTAP